jgi:hypothetical protein
MSMFMKLPSAFYDATAFDGFSPDRDFHLGSANFYGQLERSRSSTALEPSFASGENALACEPDNAEVPGSSKGAKRRDCGAISLAIV